MWGELTMSAHPHRRLIKFLITVLNFFHKYIRRIMFYSFPNMTQIFFFANYTLVPIYFDIYKHTILFVTMIFCMLFLLPGTSFPKDSVQMSPLILLPKAP